MTKINMLVWVNGGSTASARQQLSSYTFFVIFLLSHPNGAHAFYSFLGSTLVSYETKLAPPYMLFFIIS